MRRFLRYCAAALGCVLLTALPAAAQFDRGQISGTVKDAQGGVVPGVTVSVTNLETQQMRTTVTDSTGYYTVPNLPGGKYDVSAELQGFKKALRQNVTLDSSSSMVLNISLETGALTEAVTVTAEATPLQTDVAVRKTVEAKDIELLSFSGRNPIGVPALKAGVIGGSFNTAGFSSLTTGGFNINGSRSDENTIYVDGAVAVRTRSTGAIVGVQNVDAVQEVQVLTANYMPEYGRASGGQIRFITKGGSSRYSGSTSFFWRDDSLQANTWTRNKSPNALENSGPAPFNYKQYGYSVGGPIPGSMFRDKAFFFAAQEWVNFFQVQTNTATVPTALMRTGDFSELLNPSNGFYSGAKIIRDPQTGQPFAGNIIPSDRLSPNGIAIMNLYPLPTSGFRSGTANAIVNSENPQDQRKDNIRIDYRINDKNQVTYRYSKYTWTAVDAFRGTFPFARTDWDRPNSTQNINWTSTITPTLINEFSYAHSLDQVFIGVFKESGLYKRSRTGVNYPYIFPANKEIEDKIPTVNIDVFSGLDGGPYPSSSQGPIHLFSNATTWVSGRHTVKGGVAIEYSGEDDFDQINVSAIPGGTNNQNGQFAFRDSGTARTGLGIADMALGVFQDYAELGQRAFTKWRALATDIFVQDSWKPRTNLTVEGGVRWAIWPPWYSQTNNIANFDPRFYNKATEAIINPSTGRLVGGDRYNGIVLPGDGFKGDANNLVVAADPKVQALFRGEPRGFSETHYNAFEPRLGVSYQVNKQTIARASTGIFHNRVTLNDSTLLGGNPPFQPMVAVSNGSVDNPGGAGGASDLPFGIQGQDVVFKHPTSYMWSVGVQREVPLGFVVDATYVGRRGLYLQRERNINQLPVGTITNPANKDINIAALRPYKGYGAIRVSENAGYSKYNSLQISADRRYTNGLKVGVAYTLGHSEDNASDKRDRIWNTYDDTIFWGTSSFDRRHVATIYYIYDLPFWRNGGSVLKSALGGWQISGATFMRTGTPFSITRTDDIAGVGEGSNGQPADLVGDLYANANGKFSGGVNNGVAADQNFIFNPAAFAAPKAGTFGNAPRNLLRNPGDQQWDIAFFKNFALKGTAKVQFRTEIFNFLNHPNLSGPETDMTKANFGRSTSRDNNRRDIQLALRFLF
jgi:Carboxypeptidase regulatory-like domain